MQLRDDSGQSFLRRLVGRPAEDRARLQTALDVSRTGTFRWDVRRDELEWDANLARLFGRDLEHAPFGWHGLLELLHPEDRERVDSVMQDLLDAPERRSEVDTELRVVLPDGRVRWLKKRAQMFVDGNGAPLYLIGALSDVTPLKESVEHAERARELAERGNAAKSNFLANMSHEIRTPLTAILGFADLLGDEDTTDDSRRAFAAAIRRNGDHLLALVNEILDLSKVEAGLLRIERRPFRVREALTEVIALLRPRADAKQVTLSLDIALPVPEIVEGDALRFRQIILNLADNAVKFTAKGDVTLSVSAENGTLEVAVRDSGPGIPPECQEAIFQPFVQVDASTSRRHGGSGLGLAIARKLAQAMNGDLTLRRSTVGEGSTFVLTLPL